MHVESLGFVHDYEVGPLRVGYTVVEEGLLVFQRHVERENNGLNYATSPRSAYYEITTPSGTRWAGRFVGGVEGLSGVFATPCPKTVCVVVYGQGYWIPTENPKNYQSIAAIPIREIHRVPGRDCILIVDYSTITMFDAAGFRWNTAHLSWDGMEISNVDSNSVTGFGWDAASDRKVAFCVSIPEGVATGGAAPFR